MLVTYLLLWLCLGRSVWVQSTGSLSHDKRVSSQLDQRPTPCGEGLCTCTLETAYCTSPRRAKHQSVYYVPKLPDSITRLDLSSSGLTSISQNFFHNVTSITAIVLDDNDLVSIHPLAFQHLTRLAYLSISGDMQLTYQLLSVVFTIRSLETLVVSRFSLERDISDILQNASLPHLRNLTLSETSFTDVKNNSHDLLKAYYDNGDDYEYDYDYDYSSHSVRTVNLEPLSTLTWLQNLDLHNNQIEKIVTHSSQHFVTLDLSDNRLREFPRSCGKNKKSLYPNLRSLHLDNNIFVGIQQAVCMPRLEKLTMNGSIIPHKNTFTGMRFPRLTELHMSGRQLHRVRPFGSFIVFSNLTFLTRVNMQKQYVFTKPPCTMFLKCPQLTHLFVAQSSFNFPLCQSRSDTQVCENITFLDMSLSQIDEIPERKFLHCFAKLTHLILRGNFVRNIPSGAFESLPSLTTLDLNGNQISVVSPDTFSAVTRQRLVHLDLAYNPIECSCEVLWFRSWIKSSPSTFGDDKLACNNLTAVKDFDLNEQACLLSEATSIMIISTISFVLVTLVTVSTLFRYRWHLRLLLYEVFRGHPDIRRQILIHGDFDYDVFVSYTASDSLWVRRRLMPALEGGLGLRLCLHERDFIPGRDIVDNIATMVQRSKKVLMVFSNDFVASQWCQFELSFCLQHAMDTEDALIIVCVDDVASRDLTAAMMAVLKTTTYIQWVEGDRDVARAFWGRLREALHEVYAEHAV